MGHNSVVSQVAHPLTHLTDITHPAANTVFGQIGHATTHLSDVGKILGINKPPTPQTPGASSQPNAGQTTQAALQNEVQGEARRMWDQTLFGGGSTGGSLLDADTAPKTNTASRVLLGGS